MKKSKTVLSELKKSRCFTIICAVILQGWLSHSSSVSAAPTGAVAGSSGNLGLGLSHSLVGTALSGRYKMDAKNTVGAALAIPATSPFLIGIEASFAHIMFGQNSSGLTIGGAVSMGNQTLIASQVLDIRLAGLMGLQFAIPSREDFLVNFWGGPVLEILDGNANFSVNAPTMLGFSLHYFL